MGGDKSKKNDNGVDLNTLFGRRKETTRQALNRLGVLMEDMASQMKFVAEKVETSESSLKQTMNEMQERTERRFDTLEAVVKGHSNILNEHGVKLASIEVAITEHSKELKEIREELKDTRVELKDTRVELKDTRVELNTSIKSLDDKVSRSLTDHERRIVTIEKSAILA